jgi:hypothetical protein
MNEENKNPDISQLPQVLQAGGNLPNYITTLFTSFANARLPYERDWYEFSYNFNGQYYAQTNTTSTEGLGSRSKIFVRLTPQKVKAAQGKIMEAIGPEIPFKLEPLVLQEQMKHELKDLSYKQQEIIKQQFKEINLRDVYDSETLAMCIYGTGILKGPFRHKKIIDFPVLNTKRVLGMDIPLWAIPWRNYPKWRREYKEIEVLDVKRVSIWNYFANPNANTAAESIAEIEREYYTVGEFKNQFVGNPEYDQTAVQFAIRQAFTPPVNQEAQAAEGEKYMGQIPQKDLKVTVIEFWGQVPFSYLKQYLPEDERIGHEDGDMVEAVVVASGQDVSGMTSIGNLIILSAHLNPTGKRIFKVCPYNKRPGSFYGIGVAESMRDSQKIINSFTRLLIDNKVLSGNVVAFVNKQAIDTTATKDMTIYPGKLFFVKGDPNAAVKQLAIADTTAGLEAAIDRFERMADEESGIPKVVQDDSSSYLNKTPQGMSMLMSQANIYLKATIRNMDDFWTEPVVMAFTKYNEISGIYPQNINYPMSAIAMGTDSLITNEIRFENLMKMLQVFKETDMMPFLKKLPVLREISQLLDLGDAVVDDTEAQQIQQSITQQQANAAQAKMSANIDSQLINILTPEERVQMLQKMGIQADPQGIQKVLMQNAAKLEVETEAKAQLASRKTNDKTKSDITREAFKAGLSNKTPENAAGGDIQNGR